jgi:hypothetical protein
VPISLIKKIVQKGGEAATQDQGGYSRDTRSANSFAPAIIQADASNLIVPMSVAVEDSCLLKVREFRSFHTSQMMRRVRLRIARLDVSGTVVIIVHHCMVFVGQSPIRRIQVRSATQAATSSHIFVYLHSASRWWADSLCRRQIKGHKNRCALAGFPACRQELSRSRLISHCYRPLML